MPLTATGSTPEQPAPPGEQLSPRNKENTHALGLTVLFGQLAKRVPNRDGGLYAYSHHEFRDFAGYLVGWCYWIQAWTRPRRRPG